MTVTKLAVAAAGALAGAAVAKELNKPADQRTWHGEVGGVPYDFRPPSVEKVRHAYWDPDNPKLLTAHVFGVGWGINVARLVAIVSDASDQPGGVRPGGSAEAGSTGR